MLLISPMPMIRPNFFLHHSLSMIDRHLGHLGCHLLALSMAQLWPQWKLKKFHLLCHTRQFWWQDKMLEMYGWRCRMCGRWTDRSYGIRWTERKCGKGAEVRNEVRKKGRCGTYNVGVKDLASAYVLWPRLAECGGLSIYERNRSLRNNEGIGSGFMTQSRKRIRTEY